MKFMKFVLAGILAATLLTTTVAAASAPATSDSEWSFTLSGNGATTTTGHSESVFNTSLSLGRTGTFVLPFEAGVRQSVGYDSTDDGNVLLGTRLYVDWTLIRLGSLELLAGGAVGADYGDQSTTWRAAPEVETRLWLKEDVYVFGRVSYGFVLNEPEHSEDTLAYGLGIGVRF